MSRNLSVAELLRQQHARLTPAERRVSRALLAGYPLAGLESVGTLAAAASTSPPTVIRLVAKLGFDGYPAMQQALKEELATRLSSPLEMYPAHLTAERDAMAAFHLAEELFRREMATSFAGLIEAEVEEAIRLLTDRNRRILTIGGRFSSMLAQYLATHLQLLRAGVSHVPISASDRMAALLDVGRRHVVVAFDYRRYQRDTVRFGTVAHRQGAAVILFTDPYLSPLAAHADVVLSSSVAAPSPFDALTPALALVEGLIAAVVNSLGDQPRDRIRRYDMLNDEVTVHDSCPTEVKHMDPGHWQP